jgi:hypothetical protein
MQHEEHVVILLQIAAHEPRRQFMRVAARQKRGKRRVAQVEKLDAYARRLIPRAPPKHGEAAQA